MLTKRNTKLSVSFSCKQLHIGFPVLDSPCSCVIFMISTRWPGLQWFTLSKLIQNSVHHLFGILEVISPWFQHCPGWHHQGWSVWYNYDFIQLRLHAHWKSINSCKIDISISLPTVSIVRFVITIRNCMTDFFVSVHAASEMKCVVSPILLFPYPSYFRIPVLFVIDFCLQQKTIFRS